MSTETKKSVMPTVTVKIPHNVEERLPPLLSEPFVVENKALGKLAVNPDSEIAFGGSSRLYHCKNEKGKSVKYVAKITRTDNVSRHYLEIINMIINGELTDKDNIMPVYFSKVVSVSTVKGMQECLVEIMPYAESLSGVRMESDEVKKVLHDVNNGLKKIHSKNVIHCDIKPSNIFKLNRSYCIGDFSSACIKDDAVNRTDEFSFTNEVTLTPGYAAPEMYCGRAYFTSDYYSLGVLVLSLLHGDDFIELLEEKAFLPFSSDPAEYQLDKGTMEYSPLLQNLFEASAKGRVNGEGVDKWLENPRKYNMEARKHNGIDTTFYYDRELVANSERGVIDFLTEGNRYNVLYEGGTTNSLVISYLNRINSTYASKAIDIVNGIKIGNLSTDSASELGKEAGLAYLASLVCADGKHRWRGKIYNDLRAIANEMNTNGVSDNLLSLIESGIMSVSLSENKEAVELHDLVEQSENMMTDLLLKKRNEKTPYINEKIFTVFRYIYHVLTGKTASAEDIFKKFSKKINRLDFSNFSEIITLDDWSQLMLYNPIEVFRILCESFGNDGYSNSRKLLLLMDKLVDEKTKTTVRSFNYKYGPNGLYAYIKNNIAFYEAEKDTTILTAISTTDLKETMTIEEQERQLYILEGDIKSLNREFQNNMVLTFLNIIDAKTIVSHNVNAFFSEKVHASGIPFTYGYLEYIKKGA
jgi:Serine/threonine protein kinase